MKNLLFLVLLNLMYQITSAQNPLSQRFQVEYSLGFVIPSLQGGKELSRVEDVRSAGQSYFQDATGTRSDVGSYSNLNGYSFSIGFFNPIKKVNGLMLGSVVRISQTGSQPSKGGYSEGYYFNFITFGVALKYYPFTNNNLYARTDVGMATVSTKNRYKNSLGEQDFFHQFGLGWGGSLGIGYSIRPFKVKTMGFDVEIVYQQMSTRVEVKTIGDDQWNFGGLHFNASFVF